MSDAGPLSGIVCVRGESFAISGPSGDITPGTDHGVYVRDTRFLNRLEVSIGGREPVHLSGASVGGNRAVFHGYLPSLKEAGADPTVLVTRRRIVDRGLREEITVTNNSTDDLELPVSIRVGTDFAYIFDVKHGNLLEQAPPAPADAAVRFARRGGVERTEVRLHGAEVDEDVLTAPLTVRAGASATVALELVATDPYGVAAPPRHAASAMAEPAGDVAGRGRADDPRIRCSETRFARLVRRSMTDLRSLELRDPEVPRDRFLAAGSPWFLTLFGRDSIWAAMMALPVDLDLARGTLRVLARRQGTRVDPAIDEQPGKILHEVRRGALAERGDLPPFYYGTIDATPLFVTLAHEAWCWGLPEDDLREILPHVEAALGWIRDHGDPDGDGFLEYVHREGRGLSNQGWKDSHDGIRYADGTIAVAPLALCEVQGYAYDAAVRGAELLDRFGRPGGDDWRAWAAALRDRFRARFWVEDERGPYPAVALDGDKRPVDGLASNMGHLPATGILDPDETAHVAARLADPAFASGWGLRTLAATSGGYNPLSYHCGSVWPHDTAIAAWNLARTGHAGATTVLLRGLVRAAPRFNFRLPELFAGLSPNETPLPVPYPASCRPQAWAAGGALLLLRAVLGVEARVPDGRVTLRPLEPAPFDRLELEDLPLAGGRVDIRVREGEVSVRVRDTDVDVLVDEG